ncbi:MAG: hypothetical protein UW92_C0014G0001 [Candidatus Jorgensenbacteria bacterium GW2011_GWA2_45_13]|uniref:Uncharacterized protein n=1 Tax=Candidatus Jorgensenbacteria bacterium GW2011_GWA2_45_13 TaxID=1618662 RepID=A0A0G1L5Q4_9BACT|nr:MAG: hypothetical protein UW92_C0014G0001 [Candidatus Jorgensenbacteria bacterium GW2011_GWA2_45_13]
MPNANIELTGYTGDVVDMMIRLGYAKTKTEAIRLALYQFDQEHKLTEEQAFAGLTGKILGGVDSGKVKTRKFKLSELD